ncbi:amino acid/amide ABC transporter substrate-binding protein (HAAT family) [Sediminihabitans luteus]|uniref:Amino acid/amide ABC transporter substrate-binding protein (HAAT family) n=1 Tax=Sediminihabitans luteus TaxID=1138585 RepID=A0A2M9CBX7_9CELL|nr:branched-chain amino acid ABC transporter substrate-binding protein [Sediminihabitans luteus]PJJ68546.1 amino acid/amide ABC transporter substrate-binding protein (HAAT family) [Sediminihabitans luteus]GII99881.1 branched chain amino acid ABC transporter substrate-binding protein [Sediminihabitans luteus]
MRTARRTTGGVALALTAILAITGCSEQSQGGDEASGGSSESSSAELAIQPLIQIDAEGAEAPAAETSSAADPAGDGSATCDGVAIAMAGALTGPNAALGTNILNGAKVAVDKHNAANADCQVELKQFDTEGDPQKATQVAPSIVADDAVIGLLGPAFSGETKATGAVFSQAGLLSLTASATNPGLTENGWTNFFRGLGNDDSQGGAVANYLTGTLGAAKVCVIQDDTDYGVGLAEVVTETLGDAADSSCSAKVKTGDKDFSATVEIVKSAEPDAIYYAGYYAEGAPFLSQLRAGGVDATFVSDDGANDPEFVKQAGDASKDAYLTCPCGPAPTDFATEYEDSSGQAPGVYSVEGYDLATIMLAAIDSGVTDRDGMVAFVKDYSGDGLAKHYEWDATGELADTTTWIYQVK